MVSNPVDYANACNQPSVFLAPSQGKSNLLWLLAETPLILKPLLIYGMQMHHLQSILRCEKVIGRPCVLPCNWIICINIYIYMRTSFTRPLTPFTSVNSIYYYYSPQTHLPWRQPFLRKLRLGTRLGCNKFAILMTSYSVEDCETKVAENTTNS